MKIIHDAVLDLSSYFNMWTGGISADLKCFSIIGGIFLSIKTWNGTEGKTCIYHIDCGENMLNNEESCVKLQQMENNKSCELHGDVSSLVHCHQVNQNGNTLLVIQKFC